MKPLIPLCLFAVGRAFAADTQTVELRLTCDETKLSFAYAVKPGEWRVLVPATDSYPLSGQAAGGGIHFTGALVGVHARSEQLNQQRPCRSRSSGDAGIGHSSYLDSWPEPHFQTRPAVPDRFFSGKK